MAVSKTRASSGHAHDAIRIVPLKPFAATRAPVPEKVTYRGGPLISAIEVFTIFWGKAWKATAQAGLIGQVNRFFDAILTSALIDQLVEYGVAKYRIGHGRRLGSKTITSGLLGTSVTDTAIQTFLQQQITKKTVAPTTRNTLYVIYLPPGVRVVMGGSASCQAFCGYHNAIGTKTFYAVMPYPGCSGCTGGLTEFDALTSTTSHELCEAITDPVPGLGWYDDTHGEIGDMCAWQTKAVAGYTVQLEWSNRSNACV
jgi:hypothetical protein